MATIYVREYNGKKHYFVNYAVDGKRVQRKIGTDRRQAERVLREVVKKVAAKDPLLSLLKKDGLTLEDWRKEYLQHSEARKTKDGHERDQDIFRLLVPWMRAKGIKTIPEVQPRHIQKYLNELKQNTSASNANRHLNTIRNAFNTAVEFGRLQASPCKSIKRFAEKASKPPRFFTEEELDRIFLATRERDSGFYRAIYFLASTGVRKGELERLTWEDIDFTEGSVEVMTLKKNQKYATRRVPLPKNLAAVLRKANKKDEPICDTTDLRRRFQSVLEALEIPRAKIHDLRHTYASHLVQKGVSLYVVSKLLGHSSIKTTEIYSHLAPSNFHDAVSLLPY